MPTNAEAYKENYNKTVAMVLEGTVACSWLEKEMARQIMRFRAAAEETIWFIENGRELGFVPVAPSQPALDAAKAAIAETVSEGKK